MNPVKNPYPPSLALLLSVLKKNGGCTNIDFQDSEGFTLLMYAISYQFDAFAEYLLVHEGANPFLKS